MPECGAGGRSWFDAFPDYTIEVVEAQEIGNVVLTALHAVAHGAGSALPLDYAIWHTSEWRTGKCVCWRIFNTQAGALEAIDRRQ